MSSSWRRLTVAIVWMGRQLLGAFNALLELWETTRKWVWAWRSRRHLRNADAYRALDQLDQLREALNEYGKAIRLNPQLIEAYYRRANVHDRVGQRQRAVEDYPRSFVSTPSTSKPTVAGATPSKTWEHTSRPSGTMVRPSDLTPSNSKPTITAAFATVR